MIAAGKPAPAFTVPTDTGASVSLEDFRGRWVVLFFYPRASTPGCTIEACSFRDALPRFEGLDAVILGASPDTPAKQAKFKSSQKLPFTLLADADHRVAEAFGVWKEKSFMGRKFMGVDRTTFLIDPAGTVAHVFENVKPIGHADDVGEKLAKLRAQS